MQSAAIGQFSISGISKGEAELSTTPWMCMGECWYTFTHSYPRHWMEVRGKHLLCGPQSRSERCGEEEIILPLPGTQPNSPVVQLIVQPLCRQSYSGFRDLWCLELRSHVPSASSPSPSLRFYGQHFTYISCYPYVFRPPLTSWFKRLSDIRRRVKIPKLILCSFRQF
jgi:hypothetical protein